MNEYKSVSKYFNKNKDVEKNVPYSIIKKLFLKIMCCIVIFLVCLIILRYDKNNKKILYKFIYETNFNFAYFNDLYHKYFGDILPFENNKQSSSISVFNEKITYSDISMYKDGASLSVEDSYLIPVISSGVVTFIGEKEGYGETIVIEDSEGVNIWYSNVTNINVNLYDYVKSGEFLACSNGNKLYLVFQKDEEFLDYKKYL